MFRSSLVIMSLHLLSWLSLRHARALGAGAGRLVWWWQGDMARTTLRNLELCMPELSLEARRALARNSVIETCTTAFEAGIVWLWPAEKIQGTIRGHNLELLREAHAEGKGVIVIGPHLGNWEVLGMYLGGCGLGSSVQLYQAPRDEALNRLVLKARSRAGAKLVATDARGVSQLLKGLRQGWIAGILPDQVPPASGGKFAPFFGQPALTMTLVSRLVAKTGCAAVLAYTRRIEKDDDPARQTGFEVVFRAADERLFAEDPETSLKGLNATIEAAIREAPELYQWEYKRFKRQPDGTRPY